MNKAILITLFIGISIHYKSQEKEKKSEIKRQSIFLELGGQGLFYSINYDRLFHVEKKVKSSVSCGLFLLPKSKLLKVDYMFSIPISYNFLFGKKNNKLELGIGLTPVFSRSIATSPPSSYGLFDDPYSMPHNEMFTVYYLAIAVTPKIGYRFQKAEGGFFFKTTLAPFYPVYSHTNWTSNKYPNNHRTEKFLLNEIIPWLGISFGYTF